MQKSKPILNSNSKYKKFTPNKTGILWLYIFCAERKKYTTTRNFPYISNRCILNLIGTVYGYNGDCITQTDRSCSK